MPNLTPENDLPWVWGVERADLPELPTKVFVYGTLKRGRGNHVLFGNSSTYLCDALTVGRYMMDYGGAPTIYSNRHVPRNVRRHPFRWGQVRGEVWEVTSPTVMATLDALEGHPYGYERRVIQVTNEETNKRHLAWCYEYNHWDNSDSPWNSLRCCDFTHADTGTHEWARGYRPTTGGLTNGQG